MVLTFLNTRNYAKAQVAHRLWIDDDRANGITTKARLYVEAYCQIPSCRIFGRIHRRMRDTDSLGKQFYESI